MPRLVSFWRNLIRRKRVECDLDNELSAVFELLVKSPTKMTGIVEFSGTLSGKGEWVATKK